MRLILLFCSIFLHLFADPLKIAFFLVHLTVRGTEVATYDYADCNETLLGNESIVVYVNAEPYPECRQVREQFERRFGNRFYECSNFQEMDEILLREKVDLLYLQISGQRGHPLSKVCKNAVHAVFLPLQPFGDVYASISHWLSGIVWMKEANPIPFVPYMVRLDPTTDTLHEELGIPRGAVVFGRHGGNGTFDIPMAHEAVIQTALAHEDWYFIFLNTDRFCNLRNVIFLPETWDLSYKTKFINTCDAMIHARSQGESFGLACAEFSIRNKPVITWSGCGVHDRCHIDILEDKGFYYSSKEDLLEILTFVGENVSKVRGGTWDAYSEKYSPQAVMNQFREVFILPFFKTK